MGRITVFQFLDKMYNKARKMVKIKFTEGEIRLVVVFPHLIAKAIIVIDDVGVSDMEGEELIKITCDFDFLYKPSIVALAESDDD